MNIENIWNTFGLLGFISGFKSNPHTKEEIDSFINKITEINPELTSNDEFIKLCSNPNASSMEDLMRISEIFKEYVK